MVRRLTALIAETFGGRGTPEPVRAPVGTMVRDRINLAAKLREAESVVQRRLNGALRRRLSDRVMDVFHEACLSGDMSTAEELMAVLESMHRRRQVAAGDRRLTDEDLVRAREELASRKLERVAAEPSAAV